MALPWGVGSLAKLPRGRFVATHGGVFREAAAAGLGLAVLPYFIVARDVAAGRLRLVMEGARRAEIGVYAVTAHRTELPPRVRAFIDFAVKHFHRAKWAEMAKAEVLR